MAQNNAVFLDRDGVLIYDKGYICSRDRVEFLPGVFELMKSLQDSGYLLIVVTNQSGVARGFFELQDVIAINDYICEQFERKGVKISTVYFCPHHPVHGKGNLKANCDCRKPRPGMLLRAIREWNLNPAQCWMIGDKDSDVLAAKNAGIKGIMISESAEIMSQSSQSGQTAQTGQTRQKTLPSLREACEMILRNTSPNGR